MTTNRCAANKPVASPESQEFPAPDGRRGVIGPATRNPTTQEAQRERAWSSGWEHVAEFGAALSRACAEILFLQGSVYGLVLWAALFLRPGMACTGVLAVAAAFALACVVGLRREFLRAGHYIFNPLLVGLALGYRFELTPLAALLALIAGAVTLTLTMLLAELLAGRLQLPVLSLPFSLVSVLAYLAAPHYAAGLTPVAGEHPLLASTLNLPLGLVGFFKALGSVVFLPSVVVGIVFGLLLVRYSRILFALAVWGFAVGTLIHGLLLGSLERAWLDAASFNYLLIAIAVGGVLLIPSLQSFLVATAAVAAAPLLLEAIGLAGAARGIPPFTLPFCLATLGTVHALRLVSYPWLSAGIGRTPEEVRENALVNRVRFHGQRRTLYLPFAGKWTVWQGFHGRWTHQGKGRYAYDFLVTDEEGRTHRGPGEQLSDYYCYQMPVLAPIRGQVLRVIDTLADNPPGSPDGGNNWGNLVVLQDPQGFYVELSHFAPKSLRVKAGDWVERGAVLGLCGNSGHSPQPHIHVQVQDTEALGAETLPFSFVSYRCGDAYLANDLPAEGERVEPLYTDERMKELTNFLLDDVQQFELYRDGQPLDRVTLEVKIAVDGTYYFDSSRGKLYFGKHEGTFYFYRVDGDDPALQLLLLALPRLPLAYAPRLSWHDYIPASTAAVGRQRFWARFVAVFWARLARTRVDLTQRGRERVEATVQAGLFHGPLKTSVEFDPHGGFAVVRSEHWELRRCIAEAAPACPAPPPQRTPLRRSRMATACGIATLLAAAAVFAPAKDPQRNTEIHAALKQSVAQEQAQDYAQAIRSLLAQQQAHPQHYTLNLRLGWLYYLNAQQDEALRCYRAAIEAAPQSVEARLGYLLPLLALARYGEAEAAARDVLVLNTGDYYGNLRLAFALRMQKKYDAADEVLQRMLTCYPADTLLRAEAALLQQARSGGMAAPLVSPAEQEIQNALARSVEWEGKLKPAEALQAIADFAQAHPEHYTLALRMGWLDYLQGRFADAARHYQAAVRIAPAAIEARLGCLLVLLAQGQYRDAELTAAQIVKIDPVNYYANLRLAVALRLQKKYAAAEEVVARMLIAHPADVTYRAELGALKAAQGDSQGAAEAFAEVLALDPKNAAAAQNQQAN